APPATENGADERRNADIRVQPRTRPCSGTPLARMLTSYGATPDPERSGTLTRPDSRNRVIAQHLGGQAADLPLEQAAGDAHQGEGRALRRRRQLLDGRAVGQVRDAALRALAALEGVRGPQAAVEPLHAVPQACLHRRARGPERDVAAHALGVLLE